MTQNTDIQQDIEQKIQRVAEQFSGEVALAAKNLATGEEILFQADRVYGTASVIKLPILIEVFRQAYEGDIDLQERLEMQASDMVGGSGVLKELTPDLQPTIYDLATLMVIISDNTATNMLIDRIGGVNVVNRTMQDRYGLRSVAVHNRVDFDRIGPDIRQFGEASAADLMQLMEMLIRREIVDAQASEAILDILGRQQYLDQVPRYFDYNPYARELNVEQRFRVVAKTGFFPGTRVDAGGIFLPGDVAIAYCAMTQYGTDTSMAIENEGAVVNGLLGRLILEYWWPENQAPLLQTPYVDCFASS